MRQAAVAKLAVSKELDKHHKHHKHHKHKKAKAKAKAEHVLARAVRAAAVKTAKKAAAEKAAKFAWASKFKDTAHDDAQAEAVHGDGLSASTGGQPKSKPKPGVEPPCCATEWPVAPPCGYLPACTSLCGDQCNVCSEHADLHYCSGSFPGSFPGPAREPAGDGHGDDDRDRDDDDGGAAGGKKAAPTPMRPASQAHVGPAQCLGIETEPECLDFDLRGEGCSWCKETSGASVCFNQQCPQLDDSVYAPITLAAAATAGGRAQARRKHAPPHKHVHHHIRKTKKPTPSPPTPAHTPERLTCDWGAVRPPPTATATRGARCLFAVARHCCV